MKAIAVIEPGRTGIIEIEIPQPGPYQALVRTEVTVLCNSTDSKLVSGQFPGIDKYPIILGHEGCGIIQAVGTKVKNFKVGDRVIGGLVFEFSDPRFQSGWGGFCEYTLANDHDAMVSDGVADTQHGWFECYEIQRKVEADIKAEEAALLCTWREVYGGFGDFNLQKGQEILVFGAGPVGLSFVKLGKLLGLKWVGVVDPLKKKREKALSLGADAVFDPQDYGWSEQLTGKLDAVVDAVGSSSIINSSLQLIKTGGSICGYGVITDQNLTINKSSGPLNFNLLIHQWPTRWREREAQIQLCGWIREGRLLASEFVTHQFRMDQIDDALAAVKSGQALKCLLWY